MKIPQHIGIIVDGNGRWATNRGLSRSEGHKAGAKRLDSLLQHIFDKGIHTVSLFVFSTENFKRSKEEVNNLMNLFIQLFKKDFKVLKEKQVKVVFSGRTTNLPNEVIKTMEEITNKTKDNTQGIINFCLNYGGRSEIVDACKKYTNDVINGKRQVDDLDETMFEQYLYQSLPPLDFLIRTGHELRVSNFLLWQLAYTELYFTDILFPDFENDAFDKALEEYDSRDRRFGGVKNEKTNH